jgi:rhodanese-related sulfurtransferase
MSQSVDRISVQEFADRFNRGESFALLDVREFWERKWAAIPVPENVVDVHVPMGVVTESLEAIRRSILDRPLVVYCHHGVRSRMVAEWLAGQGVVPVLNLEGGIEAWSLGVDPAVKRY